MIEESNEGSGNPTLDKMADRLRNDEHALKSLIAHVILTNAEPVVKEKLGSGEIVSQGLFSGPSNEMPVQYGVEKEQTLGYAMWVAYFDRTSSDPYQTEKSGNGIRRVEQLLDKGIVQFTDIV